MKVLAFIVLLLLVLNSCSVKKKADNRFNFISATDSIPTLLLDIKKNTDTIRQEINELYAYDLCTKCTWADFKIPFKIENKDGFLKVMADFDYPCCKNCPVPIRLRYYYTIALNQYNRLFVINQVMELDSLYPSIRKYLSKVGVDDDYPEKFQQVNYRLIWTQETNRSYLDSVLTKIYKAHLDHVEMTVNQSGQNFLKLNSEQLKDLKEKYPLRIEFDLGKMEKERPSLDDIKVLEPIENREIEDEFKEPKR